MILDQGKSEQLISLRQYTDNYCAITVIKLQIVAVLNAFTASTVFRLKSVNRSCGYYLIQFV